MKPPMETPVAGCYGAGCQVIETTGLPEGYVPPSASLDPPAQDQS